MRGGESKGGIARSDESEREREVVLVHGTVRERGERETRLQLCWYLGGREAELDCWPL